MKRLLYLSIVFGFVFIIQGCAVYPYGPPAHIGYGSYYGHPPHGNFNWGGGRHWDGGHNRGFGGHHGWGGGHGRH